MHILFAILSILSIQFACEDDNGRDAIFTTLGKAIKYQQYFKEHHTYRIVVVMTFKDEVWETNLISP